MRLSEEICPIRMKAEESEEKAVKTGRYYEIRMYLNGKYSGMEYAVYLQGGIFRNLLHRYAKTRRGSLRSAVMSCSRLCSKKDR